MLKFNEKDMRKSFNGALKLRKDINDIIDNIFPKIDKICYMGIGGTYASSMQAVTYLKEKTSMEVFVENASVYLTTGNKRIDANTFIIISSVTGTTPEMVDAIKKAKSFNAKVLGFINKENTPLYDISDYVIKYDEHEQLKFLMVADRILFNNNEFFDYDIFYKQLDDSFTDNIVRIEKEMDSLGEEFALKHHNDQIHYFVASGLAWGIIYSYAMCYWEEQHWLRSRPIESGEFFHGLLEVIDKNTPVTIYITEDKQRSLSLRVAGFISKICSNYTIFDTRDVSFFGLDDKYRNFVSPFIIQAINRRIDAHIEKINCHPMEIRRYYRQLKY